MKKLIALIAGTAVMLSMSVTSFAAVEQTNAAVATLTQADGTYTATLVDNEDVDNDLADKQSGKQTTIVAYKGATIEVGSIQYINQDATKTFSFQLKDELGADDVVTVAMGGENIDKTIVGTISADKATTVALSGSITSSHSSDLTGTVNLYAGSDTSVAPAYTAAINVDGTYKITGGVAPGSYTFEIVKPAHITYTSALTVSEAKEVTPIELIAGDTDGSGIVDLGDTTAILSNYKAYAADTTSEFAYEADTDGSEIIDLGDMTPVLSNYKAYAAGSYQPIN